MIRAAVHYLTRRPRSIAFHIRRNDRPILHTVLSGIACLTFFGAVCVIMAEGGCK